MVETHENMSSATRFKRLSPDFFTLLVYFALFLFIAWRAPFIVGAILIAFYLSIVLKVPYELVLRFTKSRLAARASYVVVLLLLTYGFVSFFPITIAQLRNVYQSIRNAEITELPDWAERLLHDLRDNLSTYAVNALNIAIRMLPNLITMLLLTVVTLVGLEEIKKYLGSQLRFLFIDNPELGTRFLWSFYTDVKKFVRTQVLVSLVSTTLTSVGLLLIGIPYVPTFAVLTFFSAFFPFVGLLFTAVPMYLVALTSGGLRSVVWLTVTLVTVNQLESWTYGPRFQSRTVRVHWFFLLTTIFVFGTLLSFVGVLLALPGLIFVKNLWSHYWIQNLHEESRTAREK